MENVYDKFSHYEKPLNDFERARQQISTPFDYYDVDLSVARTNEILPIAGDFLYIDLASTGEATLELNNQHDARKAPFKVIKGFALNATFKQLKFTNVAQAGAIMRIMFSTGDKVIPATSQMQISGNVATLEDGYTYGGSFKSNTSLAANGVETIFTPAANVNGAILQSCRYSGQVASGYGIALIAKTSAPANVLDGDVIASNDINVFASGSQIQVNMKLERPVSIPAGKGLYLITAAADALTPMKSVLYTLK
jgi:hypothetical protein